MWLRNLFMKTVRDLRGQIVGWGIGAGLLGWMVILLYPAFKDQMAGMMDLLKGYPPALMAFFGDMSRMADFRGWLNIEFYSYGPPILAIFAVGAGSGLIAGEEERGTLDLLLSHPVRRWRLVAEKFAGLVVATILIMILIAILFVIGAALVGETDHLDRIVLATLNIVPITLASGALALMLSVVLRSKRLATTIALVVVIIVFVIIKRTPLGLQMRAVGASKAGAQFAGINVNRTMLIAALVSGGIAGLAGVSEIAGIHYHLISELSGGYGYTGIIVATLGGLNPFGATIAALFIGLIDTGAQTVSRVLGVPVYLGDVVQSTLLLVTLGMLLFQNYRIKRI